MNILLLEDDSLIADLVEMVLTNSVVGARVTHATSVGQAKTAWSRQPAQLVLCDWNLPDGTGLELVKFIRSTDTVTPIVMISASSDRQHVMAAA
ncbi:MAG: response regulator, partial [Gammaproteobacteria bacterium]|nr:response regulator [Gammaproteobacteria bacterium]